MYETAQELDEVQALLDRSIAGAGDHLKSIIEPGRRTLDAHQLVKLTDDVCVLNLATTTSAGEPRLSGVDGHFLHGHWYFSTAAAALKTRHLRARPAASVAWTPRDGLGVWAHGSAVFLQSGSAEWDFLDDHLALMYGASPTSWGIDVVLLRLDAHWMVGFAMAEDEQTIVQDMIDGRRRRRADRAAVTADRK